MIPKKERNEYKGLIFEKTENISPKSRVAIMYIRIIIPIIGSNFLKFI